MPENRDHSIEIWWPSIIGKHHKNLIPYSLTFQFGIQNRSVYTREPPNLTLIAIGEVVRVTIGSDRRFLGCVRASSCGPLLGRTCVNQGTAASSCLLPLSLGHTR